MKDHLGIWLGVIIAVVVLASVCINARANRVVIAEDQAELPITTAKSWTANVMSVHDGDTITAMLDLEYGVHIEINIRLYGVLMPELNEPAGKLAREQLALNLPKGTEIFFTPLRGKRGGLIKSFDRYVGMIERKEGLNSVDIAPIMIRTGFGSWSDAEGNPSNKPPPMLK